jgi:hypothetical protein
MSDAVAPPRQSRRFTYPTDPARTAAKTRSGWLSWGTSLEAASKPKPVRGIDDAVDLVSGFYHECVLSRWACLVLG